MTSRRLVHEEANFKIDYLQSYNFKVIISSTGPIVGPKKVNGLETRNSEKLTRKLL